MILVPADSLQDINFRGDPCSPFGTIHQDMMFSIYLFFVLSFTRVGRPFPASPNEVDDSGSAFSNAAGLDLFGSDALSAGREVPNADTNQIFSLASSSDASLFTDEPSDDSGLTISPNLPSTLAISGVGPEENIFGTTTLDDGLLGGFLNNDGSGEPFELAANPSIGSADGCVSGKRKRLVCQNPETDTDTGAGTQTETKADNQERPLDETIRHMSGLDSPGLLQKEMCMTSFEPVCCTGQDYLGLLQTGCSKCRSSS